MDNRINKMPSQGLHQGIVPNLQLTAMQCKPEVALVPHWPTSPSYHQARKKCQKTYPRNPCANQLEVVVHTLLHPKNLLPSSQGHLECPLHVTQQMWGAPKFLAVRDSIHRVPFWSYNFRDLAIVTKVLKQLGPQVTIDSPTRMLIQLMNLKWVKQNDHGPFIGPCLTEPMELSKKSFHWFRHQLQALSYQLQVHRAIEPIELASSTVVTRCTYENIWRTWYNQLHGWKYAKLTYRYDANQVAFFNIRQQKCGVMSTGKVPLSPAQKLFIM